jgi:hypothetical protein
MISKLSCPVPKEQRPINEYTKLVRSNFYNWPISANKILKTKVIKPFFMWFLVTAPFSNLIFDFGQSVIKFFLLNVALFFFFYFSMSY